MPKREPMPLLHRAMRFAAKRHRGQDREGAPTLPYATHPTDVVNILRYEGGVVDEEVLAAGFLHDLIEETDTSVAQVTKRFGDRVGTLVEELTRSEPSEAERDGLPERELWELRSRLLLDGIARMSRDAQRVKLADRVSNLRGSHATREGEKLDRYLAQSEELLKIVPRNVCPPLWDRVQALSRKGAS